MALNKTEREILDRAYECLNRLTGLQPLNPADIKQVSRSLKICTSVSRELMYAIFALKVRDYDEAAEQVTAAEHIISEGTGR